MQLEIIVRQRSGKKILSEELIHSEQIREPQNLLELGFRHEEQVKMLEKIQSSYIPLQWSSLMHRYDVCPDCKRTTRKNGVHKAHFHSSLSDHILLVQGYSCRCGWQIKPTIHGEFGSNVHPDLLKIQASLGSKMSYQEAQATLSVLSCDVRSANNHVKIAQATQRLGSILNELKLTENIQDISPASHLYMHVDGGHIKDKDRDKRSFEAMIVKVFKPESCIKINDNQNLIEQKQIAASALNDNGQSIKTLTLKSLQKEGLSSQTTITAFCDGASNCWSVVDSLQSHCGKITKILDWYHIRQAYERLMTALPQEAEALQSSKYKIWHGKSAEGITKLQELEKTMESRKLASEIIKKITSVITYLSNNQDKLVNYRERKDQNIPYTSSIAESTVESIINMRFKRKQKMQWTRANAHNVLQLRTSMASNEWSKYQSNIDQELIKKVA
jgi:hypothetical protein